MNTITTAAVEEQVEELASTFIFGKKSIKQEILESLNAVNIDLSSIPPLKEKQASLTQNLEEMQKAFDVLNLKQKKLSSVLAVKSDNLDTLSIKHKLVSSLLSSKSTNEGLQEFNNALHDSFIPFANQVNSIANEAEMLLRLQAIETELVLIASYPALHAKNVVAVGGGFSSGKSEFISSFIKNDIKLPIGIVPTTAIPTYVLSQEVDAFVGCNHKGGVVDLNTIDNDFQAKLSHGFIKSFGFNLKEIMPFIIMAVQKEYENICFIDTPGYNPADTADGFTAEDIQTAKDFLQNASSFLWLIGADANGTISANDLDFLNDLDIEDKKVYIIFNKADLKPPQDIESILDEIEGSLDDYGIEVEGISAYSSITKEEYSYRRKPLGNFLEVCNIESEKHDELNQSLFEVYQAYALAITKTIKEKKAVKDQLQSLSLDLLQKEMNEVSNPPAFERINNLKRFFTRVDHKAELKLLDTVMNELKQAIDSVFGKSSEQFKSNIKDDMVDLDFDFSIKAVEFDEDDKQLEEKFKPKERPKKKSRELKTFIKTLKELKKDYEENSDEFKENRNNLIIAATDAGVSVKEINLESGLSKSTIYKVIKDDVNDIFSKIFGGNLNPFKEIFNN